MEAIGYTDQTLHELFEFGYAVAEYPEEIRILVNVGDCDKLQISNELNNKGLTVNYGKNKRFFKFMENVSIGSICSSLEDGVYTVAILKNV